MERYGDHTRLFCLRIQRKYDECIRLIIILFSQDNFDIIYALEMHMPSC